MDWISVIVLATSLLTTVLLFGLFYYGSKNREDIHSLGKEINTSLENSTENLLNTLERNSQKQERIMKRLQNLETIVTSEVWDAIQSGDNLEKMPFLFDEEESKEPNAEEKANIIAKKIK